MKKIEEGEDYPLWIIDREVFSTMGEESSDILRMSMAPQFASKELTQKVNRFMSCVVREMKCFSLINDAKNAWFDESRTDDAVAQMFVWLTYLKCAGYHNGFKDVFLCSLRILSSEGVAAYILMESCSRDLNKLSEWLQRKGLTRRRSQLIGKISKEIVAEIKQLISRKLPNDPGFNQGSASMFGLEEKKGNSIFKMSIQADTIRFWHREFNKRRFYLDVTENEKFKAVINKIINYASFLISKYAQNEDVCNPCVFSDEEKFWEIFYSYPKIYSLGCNEKKCKLILDFANDSFNALDLKNDDKMVGNTDFLNEKKLLSAIYESYGLMFTELCDRSSSELLGIYQFENIGLPPYSSVERDVFNLSLQFEDFVFLDNPDVVCTNIFKNEKKIKVDNRYIQSDQSNIVGLWIWDHVNYLKFEKRKINLVDIIIDFVTNSCLYKNIGFASKNFGEIQNYKDNLKKKGERDGLTDIVREHRNDYYRVDESIRAGIILSTDAALERRRRRNKTD